MTLGAVLAAGAVLLHAQTDLNGVWVLKVPRGDGTFRKTYYELKQEGQTVTMSMMVAGPAPAPVAQPVPGVPPAGAPPAGPAGGRGPTRQITASITGGRIRFEMPGFGAFGQKKQPQAPAVYEGPLENGRFVLTITGGSGGGRGGPAPTSAVLERSTREAFNLPRLPLPQLVTVKSNGLAKTPPMGWNSWNLFRGRVDDKLVREIADAMVSSGMKKAGYLYVNIDDTWEGESRDAQGNITTNNKFPDMRAL